MAATRMKERTGGRVGGLWLLKLLFRVVVLALVTWGIWKTVRQARLEFAAHEFSLQQVDYAWLCAAGLLYLAGLAPCGVFWHRTLWAMGQQPTWRESMRAFWIGHLGKYVPGKAMVVILRTGLIYSERVNRTVAATSVFIETLTMMAVGAFAAAVILLLTSDHVVLTWLAVGLMFLSGVPTYPPLFRRVVRWLQVHRANPQIDQVARRCRRPPDGVWLADHQHRVAGAGTQSVGHAARDPGRRAGLAGVAPRAATADRGRRTGHGRRLPVLDSGRPGRARLDTHDAPGAPIRREDSRSYRRSCCELCGCCRSWLFRLSYTWTCFASVVGPREAGVALRSRRRTEPVPGGRDWPPHCRRESVHE